MVQSVELLLDADLDAAVRAQWRALAAAGLASQARHTAPSNRPHVTFTATAGRWSESVEGRLSDAAQGVPLTVRLGALVVFGPGPRHVLARLVVPSQDLLALHVTIAAAVPGSEGAVTHAAPGDWTPHVTLARQVSAEQVPTALAALAGPVRPREPVGSGVAVRRWDGTEQREWLIAP